MANPPSRIKQAELTRYLKAVQAAGVPVGPIRIEPNGTVVILPRDGTEAAEPNPWDDSR